MASTQSDGHAVKNTKAVHRAAAVLLHEGKILLMHRRKNGEYFWVFPGGGVEEGETFEEAVVREIEEETSLVVQVDRLLYVQHFSAPPHPQAFDQKYFFCRYISGMAHLPPSIESERMKKTDQWYQPEWVPLEDVQSLLLYPLEVRDWFVRDFVPTGSNS